MFTMLRKFAPILIVVGSLVSLGDGADKDAGKESNKIDYSLCGQRLPGTRSRVRRVIGGKNAYAHAWPWQVTILNHTQIYCGGSIISPTFLLTAAHCFDKPNETVLNFYVGKHRVKANDTHEQKVEAQEVHIHPKYERGTNTDPGDNDIALVKLKDPIKFTEQIRPICLADVNSYKAGHKCILSGWGYTNVKAKTTSNTLQELKIPLVSQKVCNSNKSYGGRIHERYLCAGVPQGGKDGCLYDSGGPLVCSHGKTDPWYQVGIMVWGEGCAQKNKYGVYANVAKFMDTIRDKVKDLPRPYPLPGHSTDARPSKKDTDKTQDQQKEKIFIAIIAALCVIIVILVTTLCIVNFYSRGYICCTATEKTRKYQKAPRMLHEQNGKLNGEVSV